MDIINIKKLIKIMSSLTQVTTAIGQALWADGER